MRNIKLDVKDNESGKVVYNAGIVHNIVALAVAEVEGAKPVSEQLAEIRKNYEEYFNPQNGNGDQPKNTPQFSKQPGHAGTNPDSEEEKIFQELSKNW